MRLAEVTVSPLTGTLDTDLYINAKFETRATSIAILQVLGFIFFQGNKIGNLVELEYGIGIEDQLTTSEHAKDRHQTISKTFLTNLSRRAIDLLNSVRKTDPKGDIRFQIKFSVRCLESSYGEVHLKNGVENLPPYITQKGEALIRHRVYPFNHEHKISASDWLHDFYPKFGLERYFVVELPIPTISVGKKDNLESRINEAILSFDEMRAAMEKSDWNLVVKESRPVWELQKKQAAISELIRNDAFSDSAVQAFNTMLQSLFDFASKFIHKEDRSKELMSYSKASKEDAILIYTLAATILNLIGQKKFRAE